MAPECPRAARIDDGAFAPVSRPDFGPLLVAEGPSLYRPRHPERTAFYRLIDEHFEEFARAHEERFEPEDGPLRPVVRDAVAAFLDCGVPRGGFARVRCPECHAEYLLCFSCRTRFFCPSCQHKRAELLAEKLRQDVLAPVAHRHVVFTIPKALRGLFFRERRLLGLLATCAYRAVKACFRAALSRRDGVPGFVAAIQTYGSSANFHPHVHALSTDGLVLAGGEFVAGPTWDEAFEKKVTEGFRKRVLRALRREERLSEEFHGKLLTFAHGGGFSVYGRHLVLNEEPARLEHIARYVIRPPVAFGRVSMTPDGRVLLAMPEGHDGADGSVALDPLEWIRRITWHIPDPALHTVRYHGAYANRSRALYRPPADEGSAAKPLAGSAGEPRPADHASWARLIRRVFECDPLTCIRCGVEMKVISFITEHAVIDKIVRHFAEHPHDDPFDARAPPAA